MRPRNKGLRARRKSRKKKRIEGVENLKARQSAVTSTRVNNKKQPASASPTAIVAAATTAKTINCGSKNSISSVRAPKTKDTPQSHSAVNSEVPAASSMTSASVTPLHAQEAETGLALPVIASRLVKRIKSGGAGIKSAVFGSSYKNKKQLMKVVGETVRYYDVLSDVLSHCDFLLKDKRLKQSRELALVVLYSYLLGAGLNGCFTSFKKLMERRKSAVSAAVARVKVKRRVTDLKDAGSLSNSLSESGNRPKYIRVNTIKASVDEVVQTLLGQGFTRAESVTAEGRCFALDRDLGHLLLMPSNTDLHDNRLLLDGRIIIQDKASCLPAHILNPPAGSHVIDACAAPGNKTSQLAAIMNNSGSITAFEKNESRCSLLKAMLQRAGVTCCQVRHADFTRCDTSLYKNVRHILVDPSCSGSGMRREADDSYSSCEERLKKLASFQAVILKKALSFPSVSRVVYSTCSVHAMENEMVVREVLEQCGDKFTLEPVMTDWAHRGHDLDGAFSLGRHCIRSSQEHDLTIGFFVALFVRK